MIEQSPKIAISRAVMDGATPNTRKRLTKPVDEREINLRPYYIACFTHSLIIIYGVLILILTFYNPFLTSAPE